MIEFLEIAKDGYVSPLTDSIQVINDYVKVTSSNGEFNIYFRDDYKIELWTSRIIIPNDNFLYKDTPFAFNFELRLSEDTVVRPEKYLINDWERVEAYDKVTLAKIEIGDELKNEFINYMISLVQELYNKNSSTFDDLIEHTLFLYLKKDLLATKDDPVRVAIIEQQIIALGYKIDD